MVIGIESREAAGIATPPRDSDLQVFGHII